MAFFDEIGKKISQTGQEAVKQTKIMANVTKYKGNISTLENKVRDLFTLIGKQYYQDHENDPQAEQLDKINEIRNCLKEIDDWKEKIQQEKGVVLCPQCGAEISANAAFCNSCGARIERPEPVMEEAMMTCSNCGSQIPAGSAFCTSCGTKIDSQPVPPMPDTPPVPEAVAEPAATIEIADQKAQENQDKVCPKCGSTISADSLFCVNCGSKIEEV